jgi:hypothetical protein
MPLRPRFKAVFVMCPADLVSGGPDACHRLVSTLNEFGVAAFISYFPYRDTHAVPDAYRRIYNVPAAHPIDSDENLIVIPEVLTQHGRHFQRARKAIWWLSVDHFVGYAGQGDHVLRRRLFIHDTKSLFRMPTSRMTWPEMRQVEHYAPTIYAKEFLLCHGIVSVPLRDPVNDAFLSVTPSRHKRNVVAYSPAKGMEYTQHVLDALTPVPCVQLSGYTHEQLIGILRETKVYIDFGYFPGGERLPREAILCGACVLLSRRGSAANTGDYPIPAAYKVDHTAAHFAARARDAVLRIFDDFESCSRDFEQFRAYLKAGPTTFVTDIINIFFLTRES